MSGQCFISYRNHSRDLQWKQNGWLLYGVQCWAEIGEYFIQQKQATTGGVL